MATTPAAIRAQMIALVVAITPTAHSTQKILAHREELALREWAAANPGGCVRRFSIRNLGDTTQALVTDHQTERVEETVEVVVAYPTDWRHGGTQALGLDDVLNLDAVRIEAAIGVASSDATLKSLATVFRPGEQDREVKELSQLVSQLLVTQLIRVFSKIKPGKYTPTTLVRA